LAMETPRPDIRDIDAGLLDRYLAGEATPAEVAHIEALSAAHPHVRSALARLRSDLARVTSTPRYGPAELAARARAMRAALERTSVGIAVPDSAGRVRTSWARRLWPIAASLIVATAAVWAAITAHSRAIDLSRRQFVTAPGQREIVRLVDGTELTLAPASRLTLARDYGRTRREVTMEGEAYFVVAHDAARPFTVRARAAQVSDVGTRFGVRAYAGDTAIRVVVAEGAVAIGRETLRARDMAVIAADGVGAVSHGVDVDAYLRWRSGELVFAEVPLRDILPELDRWYGITVRLSDPALGARAVTASFQDGAVTDVVNAIASTLGATAQWQGRTVTLTPVRPQ
jgi:transmembrane sensor